MITMECKNCCSEIVLKAKTFVQHTGRRSSKNSYTAIVELSCDCNSEKAKATELTSIGFHGEIPEEWEKHE